MFLYACVGVYVCALQETKSGSTRARLSRGKERVWSNSVLRFVLNWRVNWLSTASDVL